MRAFRLLALTILLIPAALAQSHPDWITPLAPFRIAGNLYYVGSRDLASYLIVTPAGNILINSNLTSSPPLIRRSVEQLGFRWSDTKILLISHAHNDHAGGSAQILRETHAHYMVMDADVPTIESGGRTDFALGSAYWFPRARVDRILHDGDTVTLGSTTLVAHKTPGHTRGCTTWTFRVDDRGTPRSAVIVGGWSVLDEYRLVPTRAHPASYPVIAADFAHTFDALAALPCDIFLGAHGSYFNLLDKLARTTAQGNSAWIDPAGYQRAVAAHRKLFEDDLAKQQQAAKP
jgi:metallo-beta-lactamase class B